MNVKYAYIKVQGESEQVKSSAQQHVQNNGRLHVQDNDDWVYLIVSPWKEEQFIKVPLSPARYSTKVDLKTTDCSK